MSQALSNLAVGSKVKFGSYSVNGETAQPIVWTIVAKNHTGYPDNSVTLHTSNIIDLRCFDAKEPNNSNSSRVAYGNNYYSVSNINQWLNKDADGGSWYVAAHSADSAPDTAANTRVGTQYAARPGFLNAFTTNEKNAILSTTIRVVKPTADGGSYEDIVRKVFLPSITEMGLGNENDIAEGTAWGYYTTATARAAYATTQCYSNTQSSSKASSQTTNWQWWLRTSYATQTHYARLITSSGGTSSGYAYSGQYGIRPVLNLSNALNVSDSVDSDGCYTFEWSGSGGGTTDPDPTPGGGETSATQALGNLPIGAKVKYGKHSVNGEIPEPIVWTIVDKNHTGYPSNSVTLNTTQIIDVRSFDSHEPNNPNANRVTYGNNNYQVSNLDQWLNKSDADGKWYQAAHDYDYPPLTVPSSGESSYVERPGFLHFFTSQERASLLNTTLKVLMPRIDTNAGTIQTISRKVFLLSLPEVGLGTENSVSDGTAIAYFTSATRAKTVADQVFDHTKAISAHLPSSRSAPHYWWLRTPYYADTFTVTGVFNTTTGTRGDYTAQTANIGVAPAINLSSSLKVTTTTDEDGCYTFVWPSKPGLWVGGTEKYTSNEIKNTFISLDSLRKDSWRDDLDEFVSSTISIDHHGWVSNEEDPSKCSWWCTVNQPSSGIVTGTNVLMGFTCARSLTGVSFAFMNYRYDTSIALTGKETGRLQIYQNDTLKTEINYSADDTYVNYDLGSVSEGDTIKFIMWRRDDTANIPNFAMMVLPSCDPIALTPEIVSIPGTRTNDRRVSSVYAGVVATVPKYTETTTTEDIALSLATFTDFFSADSTGTTGTNATGLTWATQSGGGLKLTFGNYGINSSTSMTTFTAQRDLTNVVIKGLYYTESNYDKITLTVAGTTVLNAISGTSSTLTQRWTGSLSKGQTIVLKFVKDSSQSATNESSTYFTLSCDPYQKTTVNKTQTGTETKLVDKKIVKGYVGGPDGKARLFFGENKPFSYTGEYTEQDYTSTSGTKHKIYMLITSGNLNLPSGTKFSIWGCGGGAGGKSAESTSALAMQRSGSGGGGGYIIPTTHFDTGVIDLSIIIGAGGMCNKDGGETSCNGLTVIGAGGTSSFTTPTGGSGGGGGVSGYINDSSVSITNYAGGSGKGISTYPFAITSLKAHCAGGAGGQSHLSYYSSSDQGSHNYYFLGGNGGSNGGKGKKAGSSRVSGNREVQPAGGAYGGGNGGWCDKGEAYLKGEDATFYGGGGGGGALDVDASYYVAYRATIGKGGAGYQGVVYIAIPPITMA